MSIDNSQSNRDTKLPTSSQAERAVASPPSDDPIHDSELKYRRLVEGIGGDYVIYTHDANGVITYVSPSVKNVLGYSEATVLGLNWRDLVGEHYVGRELADRVAGEILDGKDFYEFTIEITHVDGSRRLIEIQQRPLFDEAGQYVSMEGIAKDITETKRNAEELQRLKHQLEQRVAERTTELIRTNEQLRKSEARYRSVVNCQTEFIVRWMPGPIYTFANEAYTRLFGKTNEQLVGWDFTESMHPDDLSAFEAAISRLYADNPIGDFENRVVMPDGSVRWTQWTNQMLFDDHGNFLEYQSVGRDVTALKNAADTIREKEAHLAHMSRLATMGELVAGIAHEVHQPLHAAKTFSEAARRNLELGQPENVETAIDCTREISNAIARTATIIRRLREFTHSRAESFEHLDLNDVARSAIELVAYETRKNQVDLQLELNAENPNIQGDRIQLEQIFINLIMNAYEAMSETALPDRKLIIRSQSDDQHVRLNFSDTGRGVTDENFTKLFDNFYSTKDRGLGMGLPLCKSIAEMHGGNITFRQNEKTGMTFEVELPQLQRPMSIKPSKTVPGA